MIIYQNDQYNIAITIKQGDTVITNSNCDEMIIQVGEVKKKLSLNEISYDSQSSKWLYPITQAMTKIAFNTLCIQAQFTIGTNIYDTPVKTIEIGNSIIEG